MSEIRATTISDAAGTGPIALTKQSAAKAWIECTSAAVIDVSFNISSCVDGATTGQITHNFTNAMSSIRYAGNVCATATSGNIGDRFGAMSNVLTTSVDTYTFDGTARTDIRIGATIHGDLA